MTTGVKCWCRAGRTVWPLAARFIAAWLILGTVLGTAAVGTARAESRKNVILVVCDDLSPDLGCYGNRAIRTPHLDRLAAESVRMTHAFCTTASCSASRSVILSGLHNHANGQYGHEHSYHHFRAFDNVRSLPVMLADAGYRTARIGKLHVGPPEVFRFHETIAAVDRNAVEMAEKCREFLAAQREQPFFLYFCPSDPHRSGGKVADDPLQPNPFGNRPQGFAGVKEEKYRPDDVLVPRFLPDTPTCRAELAQYYQSVSRVDQGIGRLVEILKQTGRYDDTLLIFTSDHGIAFPGAKTTLYEPGMRIPFLIRHPSLARLGAECHALVSLVDLAPTILDFAGVPLAKLKLHGRSFLAALAEEQPQGWDEAYASHTFHEIQMYYPMKVVRTRRHKLIWNIAHPLPFPFASDLWEAPTWQEAYRKGPATLYGQRSVKAYIQRPKFELYDLERDPDETTNLAERSDSADLMAQLQEKLKAFQKRTGDPWIMKWDYE